jgi:hypothetical protein
MSDDTVDLYGYSVSAMGVAWYTPETWAQLATMPEARIEKSYRDFVRTFERAPSGNIRQWVCGLRSSRSTLSK